MRLEMRNYAIDNRKLERNSNTRKTKIIHTKFVLGKSKLKVESQNTQQFKHATEQTTIPFGYRISTLESYQSKLELQHSNTKSKTGIRAPIINNQKETTSELEIKTYIIRIMTQHLL